MTKEDFCRHCGARNVRYRVQNVQRDDVGYVCEACVEKLRLHGRPAAFGDDHYDHEDGDSDKDDA